MFFDKDRNVWMSISLKSVVIEEYSIDNSE